MSKIVLTEGAAAATPATNKVALYAKTDKRAYMKDDTGSETLLGGKDSEYKSITIENPSSSEDISYFFTNVAITVTEIRAVLVGSSVPSVTWTIRHGTDRAAGGSEVVTGGTVTADTTTGSDVTSFDDETIVADSHVWVETTAQSGTVDSISISLFFTED